MIALIGYALIIIVLLNLFFMALSGILNGLIGLANAFKDTNNIDDLAEQRKLLTKQDN